jgi:hypothetical protein
LSRLVFGARVADADQREQTVRERRAVFKATVSSVSPKCVRRSLCPISTRLAPTSWILGAEISPAQAPASAQCIFCAPTFTRVFRESPRRRRSP